MTDLVGSDGDGEAGDSPAHTILLSEQRDAEQQLEKTRKTYQRHVLWIILGVSRASPTSRPAIALGSGPTVRRGDPTARPRAPLRC